MNLDPERGKPPLNKEAILQKSPLVAAIVNDALQDIWHRRVTDEVTGVNEIIKSKKPDWESDTLVPLVRIGGLLQVFPQNARESQIEATKIIFCAGLELGEDEYIKMFAQDIATALSKRGLLSGAILPYQKWGINTTSESLRKTVQFVSEVGFFAADYNKRHSLETPTSKQSTNQLHPSIAELLKRLEADF